jgi:hypothetical protein
MIERIFRLLLPKYGKYASIIVKNKWKGLTTARSDNEYIFILSPPYCGSTLLNELISTSPLVSVNNIFESREGQQLPTTRKLMFDHERRWDATLTFDWEYIKREWSKYWDVTKPFLLEKSPPNVIRVEAINKAFSNPYFIIFYRNPYAHCESLIRRRKKNNTPKVVAEFAIQCLEYQMKNKQLAIKSISTSYEDLTRAPEEFKKQLSEFIPGLTGLQHDIEFNAHNFKKAKMKITNLNTAKINKLSQSQLDEINEVFCEHLEVLDFFGYDLIRNAVHQ